MSRFKIRVNNAVQSTGGKSLIGVIGLILLLWIIAFFPAIPIPLSNGLYFYLFPQDLQYYLRAWLYFIMFMGFQVGIIWIYIKIGKFIVENWKNVINLPALLDKKLKRLFR